jgi:VWFA-related protein
MIRWRLLIGVVAVAVGAVLSTGTAGQQLTFSAATRLVRVDVLVTEEGRPVGGLTAADFEVFDNGVKQSVSLVAADAQPLDVVLALDMSRSISSDALDTLRRSARAAVGALQPDDHVGVVALGRVADLRSPLTLDRQRIFAALASPAPFGETALIDAVQGALVMAGGGSGRPLIIVFTDGEDTASFLTAESVLTAAGGQAAVVYGVTTNTSPVGTFLRDVASHTGGRLLPLRSISDVERSLIEVFNEFRQRYLLGYQPTGVDGAGWHKLDVRIRRRGAEVTARPGYFASR